MDRRALFLSIETLISCHISRGHDDRGHDRNGHDHDGDANHRRGIQPHSLKRLIQVSNKRSALKYTFS